MALVLTHWSFWLGLTLYLAGLIGLRYLVRLRWQPAFWLRLILVLLTMLVAFWPTASLAGYSIPQREIAILDLSESVEPAQQERAVVALRLWQETASNRLVIVFAGGGQAAAYPAHWLSKPDFEAALSTGADLFDSEAGRLLIFTGAAFPTNSGIENQLLQMKALGVETAWIPLAVLEPDVSYANVSLAVPAVLWSGVPTLTAVSQQKGTADDLTLLVNGVPAENYAESLWLIPPQGVGITTLEVRPTDAQSTAFSGTRFAAVEVLPAPRVLLLSQSAAASVGLASALSAQGLSVDVLAPEDMPTTLAALMDYQVIFLQDILANRLTLEQMQSMETFVAELGRGLVVLGGRNSYTLGGYAGTPLETLLPLSLQTPSRGAHAPITFVMVLDRSGSMFEGPSAEDTPPIDLAREAAIRALEHLSPEDYLGVLTYSTRINWDVPIRLLGAGLELRQAQDAISEVFAAGGTNMYDALQNALAGVYADRQTNTVHMLLLSDGVSFDGRLEEFQTLAAAASRQGITISTISLGLESDPETMALIAAAGNGRFFEVVDADTLPRIMVAESIAARSEHIQLGVTRVVPTSATLHPALLGIQPNALPEISGYLALTPKNDQTTEVILKSANYGDPLLAAWQVGLGRVIAWTSDVDGSWANDWDREGVFWAQLARYSMPNPALTPLRVDIERDDVLTITFSAETFDDVPLNFAALPVFTYRDKQDQLQTHALSQIAPGIYQGTLPVPEVGAYRGLVTYAAASGTGEVAAPFAINNPVAEMPLTSAQATANLDTWLELTAASTLTLEDIFIAENTATATGAPDWRTPVLALLLGYWVFEIAARRRWMPWYE